MVLPSQKEGGLLRARQPPFKGLKQRDLNFLDADDKSRERKLARGSKNATKPTDDAPRSCNLVGLRRSFGRRRPIGSPPRRIEPRHRLSSNRTSRRPCPPHRRPPPRRAPHAPPPAPSPSPPPNSAPSSANANPERSPPSST